MSVRGRGWLPVPPAPIQKRSLRQIRANPTVRGITSGIVVYLFSQGPNGFQFAEVSSTEQGSTEQG